MKNKFLIVLAFVAILTTLFASVCGAYHTDIGGTYFPTNGSRPGVELITFVGANFSSTPSTLSASLGFTPYFVHNAMPGDYGGVYSETVVYSGEFETYYEIYQGVELSEGANDIYVTEVTNYTSEEEPLTNHFHYGLSTKTYGYLGYISDDIFSPEYSLGFMYESDSPTASNTFYRVRNTVTFSCYVEDVSYTGSVTPTLESVTVSLDEYYPFDIHSYYTTHLFSADDFLSIPEVSGLLSRAMTIDGKKPYYFGGHNITISQVDTNYNLITDLNQLSNIYMFRLEETSAFSDDINQVSINTTLDELPQIRNVVSVSHFWDFITSSLNTFLGLNIAPGVTLGDVLGIGVSVCILLILLKVFAGG